MSAPELKMLVIENFRSIRGTVALPLDAQVVLVHGTNGMGKTSVLSALELSLTGKTHFSSGEGSYGEYMTTWGTNGGSIRLTAVESDAAGAGASGHVRFGNGAFEADALLPEADARFFSERCYLPQATLGRLLEIFDNGETGASSPLTLFVKELLGLDPLDALIDGLHPAFNIARVRNLVPEYRRLESARNGLQQDLEQLNVRLATEEPIKSQRLSTLTSTLEALSPDNLRNSSVKELRDRLSSDRPEQAALARLSRVQSELTVVARTWRSLPSGSTEHEAADRERLANASARAFSRWLEGEGRELAGIISGLRRDFPDLPMFEEDPEKCRGQAALKANAEATRCARSLSSSSSASKRLTDLMLIIQRSTARIAEIDTALATGAHDLRSVANALAGIAPHITENACPVCDRNFSEVNKGSLATHVAAKIAFLTEEAGRLQALASERANESTVLATAERELPSAEGAVLSPEAQAELTFRAGRFADAAARLSAMQEEALKGVDLLNEARKAREAVRLVNRSDELAATLVPEIDRLVLELTSRPAAAFDSIEQALGEAQARLEQLISAAQAHASLRIRAETELDAYFDVEQAVAKLQGQQKELSSQLARLKQAEEEVGKSRDIAKAVSNSADKVRAGIVRSVFSTSLNKLWRDLFIRLAPNEQFVPAFRLPLETGKKFEAALETVHRSGVPSGPPGAMLSQGNLNTAALTLFLALHLSVPPRLPLLVLDDPVQSMDDVHIAQFAALLRTLSKGMKRRLVVAVHERALFDYLTLEMSPAFPGDSLITVEMSRAPDGRATANPIYYGFEQDRAIAA